MEQHRLKASYMLFILMATLLLFGCGAEGVSSEGEASQDNESKRVKVTYPVERVVGESVTIRADIEPIQVVHAIAEIPSNITDIRNKVGDSVKKGQPIVQLDSQDFDIHRKKTDIAVERLQLQLQNAITDQKFAVTTLENQLNSFEKRYVISQKDLERKQELYNNHAISLIELESAQNQIEMLNSERELLLEQFTAAKRTDAIDLLHVQMKEAEIAYEEADRQMTKTQINSPINGIITDISVNTGEHIHAGQNVFRVEEHTSLLVKAVITEKDLAVAYENARLEIMIPILNKVVEGRVRYISPSSSQNHNGFLLELVVNNPAREIRPGMNAQLVLNNDMAVPVLTVPVGSVLRTNGEQYVFVVHDNKAIKRVVSIGRETRDYIEINDGLTLEDKIINVGQNLLDDGETVQVID